MGRYETGKRPGAIWSDGPLNVKSDEIILANHRHQNHSTLVTQLFFCVVIPSQPATRRVFRVSKVKVVGGNLCPFYLGSHFFHPCKSNIELRSPNVEDQPRGWVIFWSNYNISESTLYSGFLSSINLKEIVRTAPPKKAYNHNVSGGFSLLSLCCHFPTLYHPIHNLPVIYCQRATLFHAATRFNSPSNFDVCESLPTCTNLDI